ncbi:MAG: SRPBCC family protein [Sphingobacteriales bacterium]
MVIDKAWDFFSRPVNLKLITPPEMNFIVTSLFVNDKAYAREIITYKISPVAGISMRWVTEITEAKDKDYFVDEQRFGPYSMRPYEHHFKIIDGRVEMIDMVYW